MLHQTSIPWSPARMRRLIFSLICSSGNAANVLKPTNVGIPSSQIRILYPAHSERFGLLRTLADSARLSLIKTATHGPTPWSRPRAAVGNEVHAFLSFNQAGARQWQRKN